MRYRLRTLLILLAILPPLVWFGWTKYEAWRAEQAERERQLIAIRLHFVINGTSIPPEALRQILTAPKRENETPER
jgi:hypothetical protein